MLDTIAPGSQSARRKAARVEPISLKKIVWPVALSFVVLVVIGVFTFEPREFLDIVAGLNPWMLFAAAATVVVRTYMGGWRLHYISRGRLGMSAGIRGQLAWDFFSNVTPSAIGGAPFAAVYVARDKQIEIGESTALVLFSVLLDQLWFSLTIPVVLIAALFMDIIPGSLGNVGMVGFLLYFAAMLVWVVAFGYATMFRPEILQRFTS
ncbi:MAG: lysylphosphatidylglycerol synthase transmembrane domain-containing protein, partial [Rhodothermales bacterium]